MTPRGYANFNSYVKNLNFLYSRQMGRYTDRQMDGQRH